jgi:glycerate dehydrogenase
LEVSALKIVLLDGHVLNPGDLDWDPLTALGPCEIFPRTPPEEVLGRAGSAEIVLINKVELRGATLARLPRLKYIGVLATGYDCVDVPAARQRGIVVTNVPTYGTASVAQMVFAHVLNFTQHVGAHARGVAAGRWTGSRDWCYWEHPLVELAGLTMGIAGFGRIGQATARVALAFGMEVLAYDVSPLRALERVQAVDLETLFRRSDVLSLHCPLTPETRQLINADRLAWMKPTALLVNTSRGGLVDERALAAALDAGRIAGAGLDVLSVEPPPADHPLLAAKNCWITPHIAWATRSARQRLLQTVADNIRCFMEGRPQNVVG